MSKTKEERNARKEKIEAVSEKVRELTPEEPAQVTDGAGHFGVEPFETGGETIYTVGTAECAPWNKEENK